MTLSVRTPAADLLLQPVRAGDEGPPQPGASPQVRAWASLVAPRAGALHPWCNPPGAGCKQLCVGRGRVWLSLSCHGSAPQVGPASESTAGAAPKRRKVEEEEEEEEEEQVFGLGAQAVGPQQAAFMVSPCQRRMGNAALARLAPPPPKNIPATAR